MAGLSAFERQRWITAAMKHAGTTYKGRVIAGALSTYHNTATGQCNPALRTLAERAGLKETAARDGVRELVEAGLLVVRRTTGGVNQYDLVPVDAPATPAPHEGVGAVTRGGTPSPHEPKPKSLNLKKNPAPLAPKDRNAVLIALNRFDSLHERPALYEAIRLAGLVPAAWGSQTIQTQILAALDAGTLRL